MLEFQQKRRIRKIMYSMPVLITLAVIAAVFVHAAWNVHEKYVESQQYLAQSQQQLDSLSDQQASLKQSVAALNTPEGVNAQIRSQYMMVKPGEQVAVIVDAGDATDTATSTDEGGFWHWLKSWF